jgi:high-affinity iron transporter
VISSLLVGLREGLEASVIVAILIAYLVKRDLGTYIPRVWAGVGAAVAVSIGAASLLYATSNELGETQAAIFEGVTSVLAAGLITWLTFWMATHARAMKNELHAKVDAALTGSSYALVGVAFFAVLREGLETAIFMFPNSQVAGSALQSFIGLCIGLTISVITGYAIYKGVIKLNLGKVFSVVGALLIVVAAGVLNYGIHEFHEAGVITFGSETAIDTTSFIAKDGLVGSLLRGFLSYRGSASTLEVFVWISFIAVVGSLYLSRLRSDVQPSDKKVSVNK